MTIQLANGARVLRASIDYTAQPGMPPHRGLVLALKGENSLRPEYVVWNIYKDEDQREWDAEVGDYFGLSQEDMAIYAYGVRLRRHFLHETALRAVRA